MFRNLSIIVLFCLSNLSLQAQDSLKVDFKGIRERIELSQGIINDLYANPSLKSFQYQQSLTPVDISYFSESKELYNYQKGSGNQGFRFNTESYQKNIYPDITLWGKATYENYKQKNLRFNETSDFDIVFPYVTADSIGGDLNTETYYFAGGLAKTIAAWTIAGQVGYKANLAHRQVDPRPKNNSSDIDAKIATAYLLSNRYAIAADLGVRYYKQRNDLAFVSGLGRPSIYLFNGLAAYNSLISGSSENKGAMLYEASGVQAQLSVAPIDKNGLFVEVGINQNMGFRTVPHSISTANEWTDQIWSGKIGYFKNKLNWRYGALAKIDLQTRKGTESLFNNDGSNLGYTKIAEISSYRYYNFRYKLDAFVGQRNWTINPHASYAQFKEQYISPFREQLADNLDIGLKGQYLWDFKDGLFGISLNLQKRMLLNSRYKFNGLRQGSGIAEMLQQNYNYLTAEPLLIEGNLRYDFAVSKQIKPFVIANASSATEIKQKYYSLTLGLMF